MAAAVNKDDKFASFMKDVLSIFSYNYCFF